MHTWRLHLRKKKLHAQLAPARAVTSVSVPPAHRDQKRKVAGAAINAGRHPFHPDCCVDLWAQTLGPLCCQHRQNTDTRAMLSLGSLSPAFLRVKATQRLWSGPAVKLLQLLQDSTGNVRAPDLLASRIATSRKPIATEPAKAVHGSSTPLPPSLGSGHHEGALVAQTWLKGTLQRPTRRFPLSPLHVGAVLCSS